MNNPYGDISPSFSGDYLENLCKGKDGIQTGPFGSLLHKEDYVEFGTPIITVEHLSDNGRISRRNLPYVSTKDKKRLSKFVLKKGDIVFSRVGSVDRNALVTSEEDGWLFSGRCLRVRPDTNKLDPAYLSYFLSLNEFKHFISRMAVGGTMASLNTQILNKIPIFYPPLPEQYAIADILSTWDKAIAKTEQLIAALGRRKKGLMQRLLSGEVRFAGFKGEWEEYRLGELGTFLKGSGISKSDLVENGIPCIRYGEIYTTHDFVVKEYHSFITSEVAKSSKPIYAGDILFAGSGETAEEIGKCAAFVGKEKAFAGGDLIILRLAKGDPIYMGYLLNHETVKRQKYRFGQGYSVVHIYARYLKEITIPFPSIEEQKRIAKVLQDCDVEIDLHQKKLAVLQKQKKGLMQRLLTGQVRVKV